MEINRLLGKRLANRKPVLVCCKKMIGRTGLLATNESPVHEQAGVDPPSSDAPMA
jgi:hypothetical protein